MARSTALFCLVLLGVATVKVSAGGFGRSLKQANKDPNTVSTVTVSADKPNIDAIAITPILPYPQTGYYCNISGDPRLPPYGTGVFPLVVRVPVGVTAKVIFANITGTIPGTGSGCSSSVVQQPGTAVQQPGTSVQQPGTTSVTQPGTTSVTQPGTTSVTQPGTTSVTQPGTTSVTQPGTSSSVVQPGTTMVVQPGTAPSTSVVQPGTTSTSSSSSSVVQPGTSSSVVQPGTSSVVQPGTSSVVQPGTSSVVQPGTSSVVQPGTSSVVQPGTSSVTQPGTSSVTQPGTSSVVQPGTAAPPSLCNTSPTTVVQQPTAVVQQPGTPGVQTSGSATGSVTSIVQQQQQSGKRHMLEDLKPAPVEYISNNGSMGQPQLTVLDTVEGVPNIMFAPTAVGQTASFTGALQVAVTTTNDGYGVPYIPYQVDSKLSPNCGLLVKFVAI